MSEAYKVGSLSDVIQKSSKAKKRKSDDQEISKLVSLFSVSKTPEPKVTNYVISLFLKLTVHSTYLIVFRYLASKYQ